MKADVKIAGDRLPPHNLDLEEAVIGSILLNSVAIERTYSILSPNSFYGPAYSLIYRAAMSQYSQLNPVDVNSIAAWLSDNGMLAKVGGRGALQQLQDRTPYGIEIEAYAEAIRAYYLRRQAIAASERISRAAYDTSTEIRDFLQASEQEIFAISQQYTPGRGFSPPGETMTQLFAAIQERMVTGESYGVPTGFYDLDSAINGLEPICSIYIIGRPSMGKTSIALQIADYIASKLRRPVGFFSLEMSKEALLLRLVSSEVGASTNELKSAKLTEAQKEHLPFAIARVQQTESLLIDDTAGLTIEEIASRSRKLKAEHPDLSAIFIDHLHKINIGGKKEVEGLAHVSKTLADLTKELRVPVICLAQLNRAVEGQTEKRPRMSDVRGCGAIEQDADVIIGLYRDEYYNKNTVDHGVAEAILLKNRNGPTITVKLLFEAEYTRFKNMASGRNSEMHKPPTPPQPEYTYEPPTDQRDRELSNAFADIDYGEEF